VVQKSSSKIALLAQAYKIVIRPALRAEATRWKKIGTRGLNVRRKRTILAVLLIGWLRFKAHFFNNLALPIERISSGTPRAVPVAPEKAQVGLPWR